MQQLAQIKSFFETEFPLNQHGLNELFELFVEMVYPKETLLLKTGAIETRLRFLNNGIVREFYSAPEKETNINFYTSPQFISDLPSFIQNRDTKKNQETLTEVTVLEIAKHDFEQLLQKYDCGKAFIELSFQKLLKHKEFLEYNRITKTPETLYKELIIYKPQWLQQIPQYHIASYLNITPETLSRIRKRIS